MIYRLDTLLTWRYVSAVFEGVGSQCPKMHLCATHFEFRDGKVALDMAASKATANREPADSSSRKV
jgi:hypothetical protein